MLLIKETAQTLTLEIFAMRLRLLALTSTTLLLAACGGDDPKVISCAPNEFNAVEAKLLLAEPLAAPSELRVQLVSKDKNINIAKDQAKLSCTADTKTCQGTIDVNAAQPGLYTLVAYDSKDLLVGSTALEIHKAASDASCLASLEATLNPGIKAYVVKLPLAGTLGATLQGAFGANFWTGQADGMVMLAAEEIDKLNQVQQAQLKEVFAAGQHVLVTHVTQKDIEKASKLLGVSAPIKLQPEQPYLDFIVLRVNQRGNMDGFSMTPVAVGSSSSGAWQALGVEAESQKQERVLRFKNDWLQAPERAKTAMAQASLAKPAASCGAGCLSLDDLNEAWGWSHMYSQAYNIGTCGGKLTDTPCQNTYQIQAFIWPVYTNSSKTSTGSGKVTDYFIVTLDSKLSAQDCYGWYRGKGYDHENRIAAYWAQRYTYQSSAMKDNSPADPFWSFDDMQVVESAPATTTSSVDVSTGFTWSLSGSGSVGGNSEGETNGSIGFSAGVSFSNTTKQTYTAFAPVSGVASSAQSNPSYARWDYDSKAYVKNSIVPGNHACGGPGFNFAAINGTDVSATFAPQASWLWQASQAVREYQAKAQGVDAYGSAPITLPVTFEIDALLGWAYWPAAFEQCDSSSSYYVLDNGSLAAVNTNKGGIDSLIFDVSCGANTEFGTMPLGPLDHSGGDGNPGSPVLMPLTVNVPFASAKAAPAAAK
ncbi:MAG: hypothetical protein AB1717_08470 [Pseudomonadota bacterium]